MSCSWPASTQNSFPTATLNNVSEYSTKPSLAFHWSLAHWKPKTYQPLVTAGADGLVVYQETYDRNAYRVHHTAGPKKDFNWRLATPERAYAAGFRRLGIGALFGLSDWRTEAIALAAHAEWLLKHCWKAQLTLSLPRLRPCAGSFEPIAPLSDRDLTQLICALRLFLPDVGIVLSTREPASLRNGLIPLGVTLMSAGSHTEPGGYTGAGSDKLHKTDRGKLITLQSSPVNGPRAPPANLTSPMSAPPKCCQTN